MGRRYVAQITAQTVSAICELIYIKAASDSVVKIISADFSQDESEVSEQLPVEIFRTVTDQAAKGSACTPSPLSPGDAAFGGTVRTNILTAETFATRSELLYRKSRDCRVGWDFPFLPEEMFPVSPGGGVVFKLMVAPSSALKISGYVVFEEIGG